MDEIVGWLMEGDPSIRWQTMQDLLGSPEAEVESERRLVAADGWGAELLAHQDQEGTWAGGLYNPKWISTTYTLLLLRRLGLPQGNEQALAGCVRLLDDARFVRGGVIYSPTRSEPETCINSMVLSVVCASGHSDERVHGIAECVMADHMGDGGWNCEHVRGASHSSFHTTISALEGLHEYERRWPSPEVKRAMADGREFLNQHGMYQSHRSEEVIQLIADKRAPDGRWKLNAGYSGQTWFDGEGRQAQPLEHAAGVASPALVETLRNTFLMQ